MKDDNWSVAAVFIFIIYATTVSFNQCDHNQLLRDHEVMLKQMDLIKKCMIMR